MDNMEKRKRKENAEQQSDISPLDIAIAAACAKSLATNRDRIGGDYINPLSLILADLE